MEVAKHAAFQTPDEGDVEVPACEQILGAEFEGLDLRLGQGGADLVWDADVGTILT